MFFFKQLNLLQNVAYCLVHLYIMIWYKKMDETSWTYSTCCSNLPLLLRAGVPRFTACSVLDYGTV